MTFRVDNIYIKFLKKIIVQHFAIFNFISQVGKTTRSLDFYSTTAARVNIGHHHLFFSSFHNLRFGHMSSVAPILLKYFHFKYFKIYNWQVRFYSTSPSVNTNNIKFSHGPRIAIAPSSLQTMAIYI